MKYSVDITFTNGEIDTYSSDRKEDILDIINEETRIALGEIERVSEIKAE